MAAKFKVRKLDATEVTPEENAMMMINAAYFFSGRKITFVEDALYAIRIRDAIKDGVIDPEKIAIRALELEGWQPEYVVRGEIGFLSLGDQEQARQLPN
jgi:hypothetical protein